MAKIDALKSHDWKLLHENWRLEHQPARVTVVKESHAARYLGSNNVVKDWKAELATAKESLQGLKSQASLDGSAIQSSIEGCDRMQGFLATTSAKVSKRAFAATFDHLERHSTHVQAADAAKPARMKSILRNSILKAFTQVKRSTEAYHLNVNGVIASLGTVGICVLKFQSVLIECVEMSWIRVKGCPFNVQSVGSSDWCNKNMKSSQNVAL